MYFTHEAELDIPPLPAAARRVHIVPALMTHSLLSIVSTTPAGLVAFAHATMFSPALSTLKPALDRSYLPEFHGPYFKNPLKIPTVVGPFDQRPSRPIATKGSRDYPVTTTRKRRGNRRRRRSELNIPPPPAIPKTIAPIIVLLPSFHQLPARFIPIRRIVASSTGNNDIWSGDASNAPPPPSPLPPQQ